MPDYNPIAAQPQPSPVTGLANSPVALRSRKLRWNQEDDGRNIKQKRNPCTPYDDATGDMSRLDEIATQGETKYELLSDLRPQPASPLSS
ncbi:hypothetical protein VTH82DRAFT_5712 [Thermothelomyces myriococcoides]